MALFALVGPLATTEAALTLSEFAFNPDGVEYVALTVTGESEDLSNFSYTIGGGEVIPSDTYQLDAGGGIASVGEVIIISRLPQVAFDLVHAVDSSGVDAFIYNSLLDLSSNFIFQLIDNSATASFQDYSVAAPTSAFCCVIGPTGSYIPCARPLTQNSAISGAFTSTGTPSYIPEPSTALLLCGGILFVSRRKR